MYSSVAYHSWSSASHRAPMHFAYQGTGHCLEWVVARQVCSQALTTHNSFVCATLSSVSWI